MVKQSGQSYRKEARFQDSLRYECKDMNAFNERLPHLKTKGMSNMGVFG